MDKTTPRRPALILLATGLAAATPVLAQERPAVGDPGAEPGTLRTVTGENGEVIVTAPQYVPLGSVTATKSDIPLIETPQSVSVITRDQIDLLDFVDAQQAVRYAAGVYGENYGPDARYDFFTVRGFTPKQYIDGLAAPVTTTISSVGVDLYGFESLDLLKGPSSTLYGNVPPGGVYNETSRRASPAFGGEIRAQGGTDDFKEVAGTVTGPVADGLSVRFTGLFRDRDLVADHTNARRVYVAPTATWRIDPRTTLTGLVYYQYDRNTGGNGGFLPAAGTLLANPNGRIGQRTNLDDPRDVFERRQSAEGYELIHDFSDALSFRSNAKWSRYRERTPIGIYATGLTNTTDATLPTYYRTVSQANFSYAEDVTSFATDNRLSASVATGPLHHKLLAGVDYRRVDNVAAYGFAGANTIDAFNPVYATPGTSLLPGYPTRYNDQVLKQTGVYGQEQARLGQLFVTLGGRYDRVRSAYLTPFVAVGTPGARTKADQERFTWRAGADYVTASGIAPYLSYATSFEPVLGTDSVTGGAFRPTTGRQWEGGVKYDARGLPSDVKLFATAAAFDLHQDNVVTTGANGALPVFGTQSGRVEVYGGEVELIARIRDRLSINGSYSYNHSEIQASGIAAEIGRPLPTTPKHKASVFVDYDLQRGPLRGLGIGGGVRHTSGSAGSLPGAFNPVVLYGQAATLFDVIVSYDMPGWRIALNGSNIADRRYVARCSGINACFYGAPRQLLGTVTRRF
ncbi:TonB-dependent siderophore receptor [Sphingomonas bacterium]|uniref:TonB-dependent siderophore receptor n=1 Tax=Sphingomonas bacterium TaxID=1895847 RepID=UPI001576F608|nr:TonB-dependent siderophore receptor [Sphingomonas bacterium]